MINDFESADSMELYCKSRTEWHDWLTKNFSSCDGIWLVYYKKSSGKPRISYGDALDEALCFGWIDGKIKRINDDYYIQYFTPRRKGSKWSETNIERVKKLVGEGRMEASGIEAFRQTLDNPGLVYRSRIREKDGNLVVPEDLEAALKKNKIANDNFENFPPSARRNYCLWIENARKPETRESRIRKVVDLAEKGIRNTML